MIQLNDDNEDVPNTIKVLIHDSYGAPGLPDWIYEEYRLRTGLTFRGYEQYHSLRYDPIVIQLMRERSNIAPIQVIQAETSMLYVDPHTPSPIRFRQRDERIDKWKTIRIPSSCKDFFVVNQYDGIETLDLNTERMLLSLLNKKNDETSKQVLGEYYILINDFNRYVPS